MAIIKISKDGNKIIDILVDDYELTKYIESIEMEYDYMDIHYQISIPRNKGFNISISEVKVID